MLAFYVNSDSQQFVMFINMQKSVILDKITF